MTFDDLLSKTDLQSQRAMTFKWPRIIPTEPQWPRMTSNDLKWPRMTPKMTKNFRLMMNMVLQREEDGGIWFTICLIGFMIALPTKILLILFFQYRLLFNIFSDAYASVTFMTKLMLLIWTLLTDGFTLLKVATT